MKKNDVEVGASYVAKVSGRLTRVRIERESPHGGWEAVNADTGRRVRIKRAQRLRREAIDPKRAKAIATADQENARLCDEREQSPDGMTANERAMAQSAVGECAATTAMAPAPPYPPDVAETIAETGAYPPPLDGLDGERLAIDAKEHAVDFDPDVCATLGCGRPSALTYLGRPRCQECYEDDVADDDDETNETPNHEETDMTKAKKTNKKSATKTTKAPKAAKQPQAAKPKAAKPAGDAKPKRISALDAAAQVLKAAGKPMNAQAMIAAMAEQGLWASPNGKTPHATLYAAILREVGAKGDAARFRKVDRGQFVFNG